MKKRMLAMLMAIVMVLSQAAVAYADGDTEDTIYESDFELKEDQTTGGLPEDWIENPDYAGSTHVKNAWIKEPDSETNEVLMLKQTGSTNGWCYLLYEFGETDSETITLEYRFKMPSTNAQQKGTTFLPSLAFTKSTLVNNYPLLLRLSRESVTEGAYDADTYTLCYTRNRFDTGNKNFATAFTGLKMDEWYNVKYVVNTTEKTCELTVGNDSTSLGTVQLDGVTPNFIEGYKISGIKCGLLNKKDEVNKTVCYLDDIKVTVPAASADTGIDSEEKLREAIAAGQQEITLTGSFELTQPITVKYDVSITADESVTITANDGAVDAFTVVSGGSLTLGENITVVSNTSVLYANGGTINIDGAVISVSGSPYAAAFAENNGTINVTAGSISQNDNKVTIDATNATVNVSGGTVHSENDSAIAARTGATVNITGGIVSTNATAMRAAAYAEGGKIVVDGGTVESTNANATSYALVTVLDGSTVEVKSGVVAGTYGAVLAHKGTEATATISGGNITGAVSTANEAKLTITGGTFNTKPDSQYLAEGLNAVKNAEGTYGVVSQFKIYSTNVELANNLNMAFIIEMADRIDWTGYTAEVTMNGTTQTFNKDEWKTDLSGNYYYIYFTGIYADMMTDDITVKIYDADNVQDCETFETSMQKYAIGLKNEEGISEEQSNMVDALLNYGAAAQKLTDHNLDNLANSILQK